MIHTEGVTIPTRGRGTIEITDRVAAAVRASGVSAGLCHVFLHHTSASLILCENADPGVRTDLERFLARLAPDGDPLFRHTAEGPDDMPAHVRTILTQNALAIPVKDGGLDLGTWQGLFIYEHRADPHRRRLTITVLG